MAKILLFLCAVLVSFATSALADVTLNVHTKSTSPATQPTADEPSITVNAVLDHDFASVVDIAGRTIKINGSIQLVGDSKYRVRISYADIHSDGSQNCVQSTVEVKANEEFAFAGPALLNGLPSSRSLVLIVKPQA